MRNFVIRDNIRDKYKGVPARAEIIPSNLMQLMLT